MTGGNGSGRKPIAVCELGFDFDGVIADTAEAFVRLACREYGYCGYRPEDITCFELADCLAIPAAVVEQIFIDILTDSVGCGLQEMPGAARALSRLARVAPLTVITARPTIEPVHDWLDHLLPATTREQVRVVATGDHDDKLRHIRTHRIRYFIDDRAETCRRLAEENIYPFVFSQPWNRDRHNLPMVSNWEEIVALVDHCEEEEHGLPPL